MLKKDINKEMSDEEIVKLIQNGDKEKFGILMERYETKLSRYGKKFLSRKENIADAVQDVFINTFQNIQNFDPSLKFSSWIYRIAHNTFVNELRKNSRGTISVPYFDILLSYQVYEDPDKKEREEKELKEMLDTSLDKLKPKYKEILILYFIEEFGYKEISDILKIPVGTVGIRIKRAKDELKKHYKELTEKYHGK